jgi:nitrate/nitrite-specific signal transduction histidine kinase
VPGWHGPRFVPGVLMSGRSTRRTSAAGRPNTRDALARAVDRFSASTGIRARFLSALDAVRLPARASVRLAAQLQEALLEVHERTGARSLVVRLEQAGGALTLTIEDSRHGFGFALRVSPGVLRQAAAARP